MIDIIDKILSRLSASDIHKTLMWMLFLWVVVLRDLDRRLTGVSAYVKKYLVLQRSQVRAIRELTGKIADLTRARSVRREDLWHANCIQPPILVKKPEDAPVESL